MSPTARENQADHEQEARLLAELVRLRVDAGRFAEARATLDEMSRCFGSSCADVLFASAELCWAQDGPKAAIPILERAVGQRPSDPLLHHALAHAHEERGNFDAMVEHYLEVLRLDEERDAREGPIAESLVDDLEKHVGAAIDALPDSIRERLGDLPVMLEPRPSRGLVESGLDPRLFGLFEGQDERIAAGAGIEGQPMTPARIVLYYANLVDAFGRPELYDELQVTFMHELAHYLGLGEDEVADLGLE